MTRQRPRWLPSSRRDVALALLVLGTAALGLHGLVDWLDRAHRLVGSPHRPLLLALRVAALALVAGVVGLAWRRRAVLGSGAPGPVGFALRGLASGLLLAWAAGSAAHAGLDGDKRAVTSVFWSAYVAFGASWTLFALLSPDRLFSTRHRRVDVVAWNLLLALVLGEAAVRVWAWAHPSPFLWDESSVAASVEARRLVPGTRYLGASVNGGGYYDEEFAPRADDGAQVVAVLADSFGVGVVTHADNFTTVAERSLARRMPEREVALHNFGVAGVGMPEYAWLLEREVRALAPDLVLLCVFVGNDFQAYTRRRGSLYSYQRFLLFDVLRRAVGVSRGVVRGGALDAGPAPPAELPVRAEPGREPPTFEVETFLRIESERMRITDARDEDVDALYARFFGALDSIRRSAGSRLRVVLIPDEFQVDDALWQDLLALAEGPADRFERELPQRRVLAWCEAQGVACLDLLPGLRAAQAEAPVYHLRDTHWNARGNRVAGEAIARFLAPALDASRRP